MITPAHGRLGRWGASSGLGALLIVLSACAEPDAPLVNADVLATALETGASGGPGLFEATERRNRTFARHGNVYWHYRYDGATFDCLEEGNCYEGYVEFQRLRAEDELPVPTFAASEERSGILADGSLADRGRLLEKEAISRIRSASSAWLGDRNAPRRIWALRTGYPTETLQDEAIRALLSRDPGFAVGVLTHEGAPEVFELLGERMTAAVVLDDRILKDVTRSDQLAELLGIPGPGPARSRFEAPILDAHLHLASGGAERLDQILERNGVARALISALPRNPDYEGLDEANGLVLEAARRRPNLVPLVTLSPLAPSPLQDLENAVERGARGVKLISGHGDFFARSGQDAIDPPALREVFRFCERRGIPILWHVNSHLYRAGLFRTLRDFPRLKVVVPHAGGYLTYAPEILRRLLIDHPSYFVDLSWGMQPNHFRRALEDLSYEADEWRELLLEFPDRFLFGSDLVVTGETSLAHAAMVYETYRSMLAADRYDLHYFPHRGYTAFLEQSHNRIGLRGLNLPPEGLRKVLRENAAALYRPESADDTPSRRGWGPRRP